MAAHSVDWYRAPLLLCVLAAHVAAVIGQDGAALKSKVKGTLPNGTKYQTSASQISQSDKQGLISSMPTVRARSPCNSYSEI